MRNVPLKLWETSRRLTSWALNGVAMLMAMGLLACGLVCVGGPILLAMMIAPAPGRAKPATPGVLVLLMNKAKEAMKEKQPRPKGAGAADESAEVLGYDGHQGISPPDADAQRPS
ncbi:MAG: hypothetical protein ACYC26_11100 [Phycisphaerales bacterium]